MAKAPILHPQHVLPPKQYQSFQEFIEQEGGEKNDPDVFTDPEKAQQEAIKRIRILEELQPGGLLSKERCSEYVPDKEEEPDPLYSHRDYFTRHAVYFRKLLFRERELHMANAKKLAYACAEAYKQRRPKSKEEMEAEKREAEEKALAASRRQLLGDLRRFWDLVRTEVQAARLARWQEEQKEKGARALDQAIRVQKKKYQSQRLALDEMSDDAQSATEQDGEDDDEDDEDEDDDDDVQSDDPDAGLTQEQILEKYSHIPDVEFEESDTDAGSQESDEDNDTATATEDASMFDPETREASQIQDQDLKDLQIEEVDDVLLDDSDESTDMSDDMGSSDESDDDDDDDDEAEEEDEEEDGGGLLGLLFGKKEISELAAGAEEDLKSETSDPEVAVEDEMELDSVPVVTENIVDEQIENDNDSVEVKADVVDHDINEASNLNDTSNDDQQNFDEPDIISHRSQETSSQASPRTVATKPSEADSISSIEPSTELELSKRDTDPNTKFRVSVPGLLRGSLREYQHQGLDWLAGLYADHTNGILADEMGLGKTIQSIALLSHVAMEHEVWGPHLIVVPTSVILNWEMEFKKWAPGFKIMTYYGNQDERKAKRRGWKDEDNWHVLITSYELVLKDQQVLRRRRWHYMILDEAHNIKNFQSQRWQTLLGFKTEARLLLTGTPLQNNLNELWSLLFFLMPTDRDQAETKGFAELQQFSEWFRNPEQRILNQGREVMNEQDKETINKLHQLLRPYLLRRVKAEVEKQMPGKYEHVIYCKLSKRQREYYDGFMSRASTKQELASGNHFSIMNCLMQLRKVCNHPDLFERRQITTSFAMTRSATADFEIKDLLVRRKLLQEHPLDQVDLEFLNLAPISKESLSRQDVDGAARIMAFKSLSLLRAKQYKRTNWLMKYDRSSIASTRAAMDNELRKTRMAELERCLYFESKRHGQRPIFGDKLIKKLTFGVQNRPLRAAPDNKKLMSEWLIDQSSYLPSMVQSLPERAMMMQESVRIFGCVTPKAVTPENMITEIPQPATELIRSSQNAPNAVDPFHEARMRLSIAFPDKRLLQYDCGKLQALDKLLRELQAGGHRCLIFTQMVSMLDILEQFINIHGHRYLRLDGSTKVEQRQFLTQRFNSDTRILAFLLSSRAGGLGLNLTGADTVIFYDLDWNPAMDKQCQDRCHRIGQTRDVHIYRLISEFTIETNILRKSNQKRMLDDVVIQEGGFTTDYNPEMMEEEDEMAAVMDKVLGGTNNAERILSQVEDQEDALAAKRAELEVQDADAADFGDESKAASSRNTPKASEPPMSGEDVSGNKSHASFAIDEHVTHIDDYLVRFMEWDLRDEEVAPQKDRSKRKKKRTHRGLDRGIKRVR